MSAIAAQDFLESGEELHCYEFIWPCIGAPSRRRNWPATNSMAPPPKEVLPCTGQTALAAVTLFFSSSVSAGCEGRGWTCRRCLHGRRGEAPVDAALRKPVRWRGAGCLQWPTPGSYDQNLLCWLGLWPDGPIREYIRPFWVRLCENWHPHLVPECRFYFMVDKLGRHRQKP